MLSFKGFDGAAREGPALLRPRLKLNYDCHVILVRCADQPIPTRDSPRPAAHLNSSTSAPIVLSIDTAGTEGCKHGVRIAGGDFFGQQLADGQSKRGAAVTKGEVEIGDCLDGARHAHRPPDADIGGAANASRAKRSIYTQRQPRKHGEKCTVTVMAP